MDCAPLRIFFIRSSPDPQHGSMIKRIENNRNMAKMFEISERGHHHLHLGHLQKSVDKQEKYESIGKNQFTEEKTIINLKFGWIKHLYHLLLAHLGSTR